MKIKNYDHIINTPEYENFLRNTEKANQLTWEALGIADEGDNNE